MRRLRALILFTLGYALLSLFDPWVAALPTLGLFYAGGLSLLAANGFDWEEGEFQAELKSEPFIHPFELRP